MSTIIDNIADEAQGAFWDKLVELCPDITTGDFPPLAALNFNEACRQAVQIWIDANTPGVSDDEAR